MTPLSTCRTIRAFGRFHLQDLDRRLASKMVQESTLSTRRLWSGINKSENGSILPFIESVDFDWLGWRARRVIDLKWTVYLLG